VRYVQNFRNSPLPLLALIACVVSDVQFKFIYLLIHYLKMECALSCWEGGAFVKKDFRDAYFKPKYVLFWLPCYYSYSFHQISLLLTLSEEA
jgi:hypothetical protein